MKAKGSIPGHQVELELSSKEAKEFLDLIIPRSAKEFGGIVLDNVKFWRVKNQVRILEKTKKLVAERGVDITQVNLKVLVPLLENASLEEDESLQDKWAAILANAATGRAIIRPLFPEILKELSTVEVKVLDAMFNNFLKEENPEMQFDKNLVGKAFTIGGSELDLLVDNLLRLGLCRTPGNKGVSFGDIPVAMHTTDIFEFTSLGRQFVAACRFPTKTE
jgi:hypothetical protein